jgi:hypothetical protein
MEAQVALDPTAAMLSENDSLMTPKEREEYAAQLRTKAQTRQSEARKATGKALGSRRIRLQRHTVGRCNVVKIAVTV